MNSQVRVGITHAGTAIGGMLAAVMFLSTRKVDLYAIFDQLNAVVASITTLIGLVTPLATAAYGVYKASTKQKLEDIIADPKAVEIAAALPVTPQAEAVANALKA